jgi:hypothetical protein
VGLPNMQTQVLEPVPALVAQQARVVLVEHRR